jgi:RNA polymerase sigma-70 factor, ECF subfamily
MTTTPDPTLLETRFSRGDQTAVPEMYKLYSGPMFVTAFSLLGDRELAADAVQRAFVQAWQAAASFDPARPLKPWLYSITRRAAVDIYRRERRTAHQVSLDDSWDFDTTLSTEDPSLDQTWQAWQVREALDKLHLDERTVLQLAYYDGYSQSEIANLLEIALGTVKSRTARAQRRLADLLTHLQEIPDRTADAQPALRQ